VFSILSILKVSDPKLISQIIYPDSNNPHSSRVTTQKHLNQLVAEGKIKRGQGFYSTLDYTGSYNDHDKSITEAIATLLKLKLPISAHREVSFKNGRRADLVVLIGKNGKALCAIIECVNKETPQYLRDKLESYRIWDGEELSELFGIPIPYFTVVVKPDGFEKFIKEVSGE